MNFYNISTKEKISIFNEITGKIGLPPFAVEKDWWVVQTLSVIFETELKDDLIFKGGTSLSKAWNLIERFSEDIDLAVNRNFFGFKSELSKNSITNLRKTSKKYISETLYPDLISRFKAKGFIDVRIKLIETTESDQDPIIIDIYYPNVIETPGYIRPRVQVEIGSRSLREPYTVKSISSFVDENFPDAEFSQDPIQVPTVNPERTFLEKVFLLHEEFQRPADKMRVDSLSRHLYDIYQLSKSKFAEKAISDKDLYQTIVQHRKRFAKLGGVDYNLHQPQTINPIPIPEVIDEWKKDYIKMQEQMIYGESPSFENMIESIKTTVDRINRLEWTIKIQS